MFNKGNFFSFYVSSQKRFSFLFLGGLLSQVIGVMQGSSSSVLKAAKVARPNVTAFAFMSSSVNPVLYVFAGSSHIRQAGLGFMALLYTFF